MLEVMGLSRHQYEGARNGRCLGYMMAGMSKQTLWANLAT